MADTIALMWRLHDAQQRYTRARILLDGLLQRFPWAGA